MKRSIPFFFFLLVIVLLNHLPSYFNSEEKSSTSTRYADNLSKQTPEKAADYAVSPEGLIDGLRFTIEALQNYHPIEENNTSEAQSAQ